MARRVLITWGIIDAHHPRAGRCGRDQEEGNAMYPQNRYSPFAGVPRVDARTAHEQFRSGEANILDVREPSEWELGHIDGANWIPLGDLPVRWRELDPGRKWICVCL